MSKFKTKRQISKQIFLISNNDCLSVKKKELPNKKLNDFVASKFNLAHTGKIIIENKEFLTIQYGQPYFFPNCKTESLIAKTNLQYKMISSGRIESNFITNRNISLN